MCVYEHRYPRPPFPDRSPIKHTHAYTHAGTHRDAGVGERDEGHHADEEEGEAEQRLEARPEVQVLLLERQALFVGVVCICVRVVLVGLLPLLSVMAPGPPTPSHHHQTPHARTDLAPDGVVVEEDLHSAARPAEALLHEVVERLGGEAAREVLVDVLGLVPVVMGR